MDTNDVYRVRDLVIKMANESVSRSNSINEKLLRIKELKYMFSATVDSKYEVIRKVKGASLTINRKYLVYVEVDLINAYSIHVYMGASVISEEKKFKDATSVTVEERYVPQTVIDYGDDSIISAAIILIYADVIADWLEKVIDEVIRLYNSTEEDLAPLMEIVNAIEVARRLADDQ
ncbi:MAG: hypothetical protein ACP5RJ_08735 [Conexivisphaera sp.]